MIDKNTLYEWQRLDPENGLIEPWLTHPFMDWIKNLDLSTRIILELGGGASTAWWRNKARWVDTVEASLAWARDIKTYCDHELLNNGEVFHFTDDLPDGCNLAELYFNRIEDNGKHYDLIIVDGIYRTESLAWALNHFKETGGIIIADNVEQDYVWISPKAVELMTPYECHRFVQPDHTNHEGRPWNTCIWVIPAA